MGTACRLREASYWLRFVLSGAGRGQRVDRVLSGALRYLPLRSCSRRFGASIQRWLCARRIRRVIAPFSFSDQPVPSVLEVIADTRVLPLRAGSRRRWRNRR